MDVTRIARLAYAAYSEATDNKNYQGLPMPLWEDLPEHIHRAWCAAVVAAVAEATGSLIEGL